MGVGVPQRSLSDLVIDASAAVDAAVSSYGFQLYAGHHMHGPGLLWWEFNSVIHERTYLGEVPAAAAAEAMDRFHRASIREAASTPDFLAASVEVARRLGWAKVYDAAYVALALALPGSRLVTRDERLRRGASRLVEIISPADL